MASKPDRLALAGLLTGALVWGLIWYPYRVLEDQGLSGVAATLCTYIVAFAGGLLLFRRSLPGLRPSGLLLAIGLAAGGCNLGYVLGMLNGEVMRVLLLFYLAPLWTVPLARFILKERLTPVGLAITGFSLAGAAIMLWKPILGLPIPVTSAEWFGLGAGFLFAVTNVLSRHGAALGEEIKSLAMFAGAILAACLILAFDDGDAGFRHLRDPALSGLAVLVGFLLLSVNMAVQYGLAHTRANLAALILLGELVVAAFGAWLLAGETMTPRDYLGGSMIAIAALLAFRMETHA